MIRLTRDGTAEPVSRDQILRHAQVQGNVHFPCSAGHEQDWQPYPVDPYSAICDDDTYIHTYIRITERHVRGTIYLVHVFTAINDVWLKETFLHGTIYSVQVLLQKMTYDTMASRHEYYQLVPDWQPRVLLGMVEARSVNVKKTTTTTTRYKFYETECNDTKTGRVL